MSFKYSRTSLSKLRTCHPELQKLFTKVLQRFDHTVLRGVRSVSEQADYKQMGWSKTMNSRHLPGGGSTKENGVWVPLNPHGFSFAVDVAPYPIDYNDTNRLYYFAGFVHATAVDLGISIRWGGDWDRDLDFDDQTFFDLVHFELTREK